MKSVSLRSRLVLSLFVVSFSSIALAFGYRVIASRSKSSAPQPAQLSAQAQRSSAAQTPLPQAPEEEAAAQEFFRFKRLPAGETLLSEEQYAPAREQMHALATATATAPNLLTWQPHGRSAAANPLANAKFYAGAITPEGNTFIGGTANHGVVRGALDNHSEAWTQLQTGAGSTVATAARDANLIFFSRPGALYRSNDGGQNFANIAPAQLDKGLFVTPFVVDALTPQRIWLGSTAVWRTLDGGAAWQQASPVLNGKVSTVHQAVSNPNFLLAGTATGTIYRTYNSLTSTANDEWARATPRAGYVSSVVTEAQNPNIVYATYATFGGAHVWRSEDAGATWQSLDGAGDAALPDVPVHTLVIDPRNSRRLFIGTDLGLFSTTDGGQTWHTEAPAMGGAIVESLVLQTTNDETKLYAFTYGNSVWEATVTLEAECTYSITGTTNVSASGGQFSLFISTPFDCGWTATSNTDWITISSAKAGKGSANVSYSVSPYYNAGSRTGTITAGGQIITITQTGLATGCEVKPIQVGETLAGALKTGVCTPIGAGSTSTDSATYFTFTVNAGEQRALSFQGEFGPRLRIFFPSGSSTSDFTSARNFRFPSSNFLTLTTGGTYLVEVSNFTSERGNFTLNLLAPTAPPVCGVFSLSSNAQRVEASGGSLVVDLTGGATCPWTVKSNVTWITTTIATGTGEGRINLTVAANAAASLRTGTVEIGGQTFTVTQAGTTGSCAITPISLGQTVSGALTAGDCGSRYSLDFSSSRATDQYTFTATEGQQIVIAATSPTLSLQINLVDQNGSLLTPTGFRAPLGTGTVTIPATGTYNLEVTTSTFSFNTLPGNYTLSLFSTASGCGYVLPSTVALKSFEADGGTGSVSVTSGNGCGWVATTHYDWIKINTPSGTSSGAVEFSILPNNTGRSRIGAILISGQSFSVQQAATGGTCSPKPITPGPVVTGSLDVTDCLSTYADANAADRYEFSATAGQQLRVDVSPTVTNIRVYLLDAESRLIVSNQSSLPSSGGFVTIPATGKYQLEIATTSFSGSVPYSAVLSLTEAGCSYAATAVFNSFEATGGEGSIDVTTGANCVWNVATNVPWITLATISASGPGHVNFTVAPNTTATARNATITLGGQVIPINQAGTGGSCTEQSLSAGQAITGRWTTGDCRSRFSSFLTFADRYSFSGLEGQQVLLTLRTTTFSPTLYLTDSTGKLLTNGSSRVPTNGYFRLPATGTYFVEAVSSSLVEYTLALSILPSGCTVALAPDIATVEATGGTGRFQVVAGAGCPWSIMDLPPWVTLTAGTTGSGSSTISFTVAPNPANTRRRGTLTIGGQAFIIEQPGTSGTCGTTPLAAGTTVKGTLGAADCRPDVQESARSITERYSFAGTAGQQVALTVVPEQIGSFTPTMSLTLRDAQGAVFGSSSQRIPNTGFTTLPTDGSYTVEVASSSASSNTNVNYSLLLEVLSAQCSFNVTPTNNLFEAAGGTGSVSVQANGNNACAWNVANLPSWVTVSEGASGTGNGTVNLKIAENTSTSAREASFLIAGNPIRIEQAGRSGSCTPTPLTIGQTITSSISSQDCRSRFRPSSSSSFGSYYARQYSFAFTAGQQLALTATNISGSFFTPYLYVYDDKGVIVAQGEARLPAPTGFLTLPTTGTYFVEVTSRDTNFSSTYNWTLNVSPPTGCAVSPLPQTTRFENSGGESSIGVVTGATCPWATETSADWIAVRSGMGTGNGQIKFTVAPNTTSSSRRANITVGGQAVTIEQAGVAGVCAVTPLTFGHPINGNLLPADCVTAFSSSSFDTFYADRYAFDALAGQQLQLAFRTSLLTSSSEYRLRVLSPAGAEIATTSGTPATLFLRLPLTGRYVVEVLARSATDYQLNAELNTASCNFVIRPANQILEASGGKGSFEVAAPTDCGWLIDRLPSWLTFTTIRYQGTTRVEFTAAPNSSTSSRSADIFVAGQTVRIQQLGEGSSCLVKPIRLGQTIQDVLTNQDCRQASFGSYYQRLSFQATAGDQFAIVATSGLRLSLLNAAGVTLLTTSTGRLPEGTSYFTVPLTGTYFVDVEANSSTAANYSLSLVPATPGCNYLLSTNSQSINQQGGGATVNVLSLGGCAWTASSDASWVTISDANRGGTGNGSVYFTVAPNPSVNVRRASLTIAGQILVVEQAGIGGSCIPLALLPNQPTAGSLTSADCQTRKLYTFDATAKQQALLTMVNLSGSFSLTMTLLAPDGTTLGRANSSSLNLIPSNGTYLSLPVSGTYTVIVSGSTAAEYRLSLQLLSGNCSFSVTPPASPVLAASSTGTLNVSSDSGCGWTALSLSSWIQIKSGSSGNGNGQVEYTVATNTGTNRIGTIVVAGKSLSIEQAGPGITCQATPLKPGELVSSALSNNDCRARATNATAAKWYSLSANAGDQLLVRFTGNFTPYLSILTATGTVLRTVRTETLPSNSGFYTLPRTGEYLLEVASDSFNLGSYNVSFITTAPGCGVNLSATQQKFEANGGAGSITLTANGTCPWYLFSEASWLKLSGTGSGTGNDTVNYTVTANTSGLSRVGRIYVNDQVYLVEQAGLGGTCQITPLTVGETITGAVTEADCRTFIKPNSTSTYVQRAKLYSFAGRAGDRLVITAAPQGTNLTPQLSLFTSAGQLLRQGERIPTGTGTYTLPATGTYWVEIATIGGYTLKVDAR